MSVNGLTADINSLVKQEYIDELVRLGMPINYGVTPPTINSISNVTPFVLKATNIPNDGYGVGYQISDMKIQFSAQDNSKLTVKMDYLCGGSTSTSVGSFIVGSGNNFTVFCKTVSTVTAGTTIMVEIFSGTMTSNGITNFHDGIIMLDNGGLSGYILNGQGRVFYDQDGNSEFISSLKAARLNSINNGNSKINDKPY